MKHLLIFIIFISFGSYAELPEDVKKWDRERAEKIDNEYKNANPWGSGSYFDGLHDHEKKPCAGLYVMSLGSMNCKRTFRKNPENLTDIIQ